MSKKTLCIIIHFGSAEFTNNCLKSLIDSLDFIDIAIVDNDPSQDFHKPNFLRIDPIIIKSGGNKSFAKANNLFFDKFPDRIIDFHSFLFVNNDTILNRKSLIELRNTLENSEDIGLVGPCIYEGNNKEKIWACGGFINRARVNIGPVTTKEVKNYYQVDYLPGAAILCRSNVIENGIRWPEKYFLGFEEAEFCLLAKKVKWQVVVNPKAYIFHLVGMSSVISNPYIYNRIRNRIIFSKYLYGKGIGYLLGIILSFDTVLYKENRSFKMIIFSLWLRAIIDDFKKISLDYSILKSIR